VFSAFLVALLGAWVVSVMPDIARDLMFSLSLPASALLLRRARMSPEADAHPGARQDDRTSQRSFISVVWRVVAALFVFGIATWIVILGAHGARGAGAGPGLNQTVLPVCAVAVGALMVVALASGRLLAQTFVYKFVLPLTLAGLLLVCAFSFESSVGVTLVCVAYTLFDMFLFIVIADTSGRTGIRAGAAFGWCRAIEGGVPLVVVILVSVLGNQTLAWGESVVAMLGVVMALVVGASVFVDGSGIFAQDRPDRAISYPRPEAFLFACQCEQIVEDYALSMRESEVMELIVRGRSVPHISERLGISRSTVKTHVARIYQKLGVGNRQEMIDLIETVEVSPDLTSGRGLGR
jgi:DNA-binding CsgD family transcriptional regulator